MDKDLKTLAKDAKKRLKTGFWEKHHDGVLDFREKAKTCGVEDCKIIDYYRTNVVKEVKPAVDETEVFYSRVKKILDSVGEVSDIIRRLIDIEYYDSLSYEAKQRYVMDLSHKYRIALERYKREKNFVI